jgi:hypothetical protein
LEGRRGEAMRRVENMQVPDFDGTLDGTELDWKETSLEG